MFQPQMDTYRPAGDPLMSETVLSSPEVGWDVVGGLSPTVSPERMESWLGSDSWLYYIECIIRMYI